VIGVKNDEVRLDFEIQRFRWLCSPFDLQEVREALKFGFGFDADKIFDLAQQFSNDTGIPFENLDIVCIVYEHVPRCMFDAPLGIARIRK